MVPPEKKRSRGRTCSGSDYHPGKKNCDAMTSNNVPTAASVLDFTRKAAVSRLVLQPGFQGPNHNIQQEYAAFLIQHQNAPTFQEQMGQDVKAMLHHFKTLNFLAVSLMSGSSEALAPHADVLLNQAMGALATAADHFRRLLVLREVAHKLDEEAAKQQQQQAAATPAPATTAAPPGGPVDDHAAATETKSA